VPHTAAAHQVSGSDRLLAGLPVPRRDQLVDTAGVPRPDQRRIGEWRMHVRGPGGEADPRRRAVAPHQFRDDIRRKAVVHDGSAIPVHADAIGFIGPVRR